jgi:DNA modification methylase
MTYDIREGDCLSVMAAMPDASVDSIVSDPPYGLAFMGKQWDHGVPGVPFWAEALRVAKPGAYLVAFGGTRTYHRLTCAIEDAGWEIRDCLSWLYGSGFPKSHDVSKAIEANILTGRSDSQVTGDGRSRLPGQHFKEFRRANAPKADFTPTTDLAREWQGWGTALKPAWEPIILARKPLIGTVAANVAQYGTGGINVDGCRIATDENLNGGAYAKDATARHDGTENWRYKRGEVGDFEQPSGRWPANVVLDEEAAGMFPESRFFYTAKASRKEREAGLEGMPEREAPKQGGAPIGREASIELRGGNIRMSNHHPTVKPIALMRWLCRLVTPPNGLVLDPFTGSGTTGCAAVLEGFRFVGIEREAEYVEIARKRVAHWAGQVAEPDLFEDAK